MAEWITAVGTLLLVGVPMVGGFIKLSTLVSANTEAIRNLNAYMEKKDKRDDEQDEQLENHENRITKIETIHHIRGCDEEKR